MEVMMKIATTTVGNDLRAKGLGHGIIVYFRVNRRNEGYCGIKGIRRLPKIAVGAAVA